jgi:AsmA protein
MNKYLKYSLIGVGGLIVLLLVAVAVISATFNPNDYKPLIVKLVKDKKQRTLNIEGDIKLAFWPKLGADLGKVSLSEHNGDKEFASIQSAKVFLAVIPLLSKQLVVDTVHIDGVHANITRFKDGTTNFDDLLSKDKSDEAIKFDVDGVQVTNSSVSLNDEMGGRNFAISDIKLKTGHLAPNAPIDVETQFTLQGDNPKIAAKMQFKGTLLADTEHKQYGAKGMDIALQGDVATLKALDLKLSGDVDAKPEAKEFELNDLKLSAKADMQGKKLIIDLDAPSLIAKNNEVSGKEAHLNLTQTAGADTFNAKITIANLQGSTKAFQSSGVSGELSGKQGQRTLSGKFTSPFNGNLDGQVFDLPKLAGEINVKDPALPNGAMKASFNVNAHADLKQEQATVGLGADIDGSKLNGNVAVTSFSKPSVKFDMTADQLDLNKILGKQKDTAPKPAADKPADLSVLKNVLAEGKLNVGSIVYDKYHIANLALAIKADGQALTVKPLSAKFDDSEIKGSVGISHFEKPLYTFDLDIDKVDADRYIPPSDPKAAPKPLDLSALKALNATGSIRIASLKYGKVQSSNIRIDLKGDGEKLSLDPFSAKIDDSQVKAVLGITRFQSPQFSFNIDIDKLDADRYITKSDPAAKPKATNADTRIDLSALKTLSASGEAHFGSLKVANIKTANVKLGMKADGGIVVLAPFSADLYQGSMSGSLNVDARAVPAITFKQEMKSVAVGPLMVDAINNDMLEGKGTVKVDVSTQGSTVNALKKALNGSAALNLADGAIKGIDIAGTIRNIKSKFNFSGNSVSSDQKQKTDFSEMSASFNIKNGVAHNEDLSIKAPILRITGSGDIDIGNETLNYVAKPTVVASLKGQGGNDLDKLNGLTFPIKLTGTFSAPKYGLDFSAIGTEIAKKGLLDKVGGSKGAVLQSLVGGDKAGALGSLLGKDKAAAPASSDAAPSTPPPASTPADKAKKKLNKLLGF